MTANMNKSNMTLKEIYEYIGAMIKGDEEMANQHASLVIHCSDSDIVVNTNNNFSEPKLDKQLRNKKNSTKNTVKTKIPTLSK